MKGAIYVGFKFDSGIGNFGFQTLNLETSRISKNRVRPVHKFMQPSHLGYIFGSRTQEEVVVVGKNNLRSYRFKIFPGQGFDGGGSTDGHKNRSMNYSVGGS